MRQNKYKETLAAWIDWRYRQACDLENIPGLCHPNQTTEQKAFAGSIGTQQVSPSVPSYFPPAKFVLYLDQGYRELSDKQRTTFYDKHVLEYSNVRISKKIICSESTVRYNLKIIDKKLKKFIDTKNKSNKLAKTFDFLTNLI